jgi:hypothetical protein
MNAPSSRAAGFSPPKWSIAVSRNQQQTNARRRARPASRGRGRTPARASGRKRRWLVLPLALGVAALALYVLASGGRPGFLNPGEPPLDDIGDASRLRLEHVLGEAERDAKVRP